MNFEKNELNKNALGGTELMMERIYNTIDKDLLDKVQIIPSRVRELEDKPRILYLHDLPNDPESTKLSDKSFRDQFSQIVMVSNWQMQMYNLIHGVPYGDCTVIHNSITPIEEHEKPDPKEELNIIYHTTPHRGLAILVPVFKKMMEQNEFKDKNIKLKVFSSFDIYGWETRNVPYEPLFHEIKNHPNMEYHGYVPNDQIREELKKSHIFAYPSVWPETSCLAAIEASSARNIVVSPNYAALPETVSNFGMMYQWHEDINQHASRFYNVLSQTVNMVYENSDSLNYSLLFQKQFFDTNYNWASKSSQWENLIKSVIDNH